MPDAVEFGQRSVNGETSLKLGEAVKSKPAYSHAILAAWSGGGTVRAVRVAARGARACTRGSAPTLLPRVCLLVSGCVLPPAGSCLSLVQSTPGTWCRQTQASPLSISAVSGSLASDRVLLPCNLCVEEMGGSRLLISLLSGAEKLLRSTHREKLA